MRKGTCTDGTYVGPLAITMPGPGAPALGEWHGHGLCAGNDPDDFFPSNGDPGTNARRICAACPVRGDCLDYAIAADELGIWGGLDQQERRNLKRKRQRRKAARQLKAICAGDAA
jgi:WhiB family transcriptional regulator, redox-sensing transcriptional regulator